MPELNNSRPNGTIDLHFFNETVESVPIENTGTSRMDNDQILQALIGIGTDGARRDEKLTSTVQSLERIERGMKDSETRIDLRFQELIRQREAHIEQGNKRYEETMLKISGLDGRLKNVEDSGIASWSAKKILQWAALTAAIATLFGTVLGGVAWIVAHLKF